MNIALTCSYAEFHALVECVSQCHDTSVKHSVLNCAFKFPRVTHTQRPRHARRAGVLLEAAVSVSSATGLVGLTPIQWLIADHRARV